MPRFIQAEKYRAALFRILNAPLQWKNSPEREDGPVARAIAFERISNDNPMDFSRREWIFGSLGSLPWAAIAAAQDHAHHAVQSGSADEFEFFDSAAAADVATIASQILPSDDGPGAKEAGVIFFIDRALRTFASDKQETYRNGLNELRAIRTQMFPTSESIAALPSEQQRDLVRAIEESDFFDVVRTHTLLGFLGSPDYGGNRDKVGWKYIGFEDRMAWVPPFGYYDAETK
jgi:gluconate 2-dehydrogenase gamma chain